jgi:hypothetical protein
VFVGEMVNARRTFGDDFSFDCRFSLPCPSAMFNLVELPWGRHSLPANPNGRQECLAHGGFQPLRDLNSSSLNHALGAI